MYGREFESHVLLQVGVELELSVGGEGGGGGGGVGRGLEGKGGLDGVAVGVERPIGDLGQDGTVLLVQGKLSLE